MLSKIIICVIAVLQVACVREKSRIEKSVEQYTGENIGKLIMAIGNPVLSSKTKTENYYTWISESRTPGKITGYSYTDPITTFVSSGTMQNVSMRTSPDAVYKCKLVVSTNKKDVITSHRLSGQCNKKNTFFE